MTLLEEILEHNRNFAGTQVPRVPGRPARRAVVLTCMDTRLSELLEAATGLRRGEAKILRNAGATITDPEGDVVRSLAVAIHGLGCAEVLVIGHLDCGMTRIDAQALRERMEANGVPRDAIARLRPGLREWFGAFGDVPENVRRTVDLLRTSPLIPRHVPVHGLVIDPDSGALDRIVDGYAAAR